MRRRLLSIFLTFVMFISMLGTAAYAWDPPTYTVQYESNGGTYYPPEYYVGNTLVRLNKVPERSGYVFTGWYADKGLTYRFDRMVLGRNRVVYAGWASAPAANGLNTTDRIAYVSGYEDGSVNPEGFLTRSETVALFYRLLSPGKRANIYSTTNSFPDVPSNVWYNEALSTMIRGGYISGYPDGTFGGNNNITRAEFVTIAAKFYDFDAGFTCFPDVGEFYWAYNSISKCVALGLVKGYDDGGFHPLNNITRAEAITIINRMLGRNMDYAFQAPSVTNFWDNIDPNRWYYWEIIKASC